MKMQIQYNAIRNIFIQSSLIDLVFEQRIKAAAKGFIINGELHYWFWRYIYMKDLTKRALTNQLLKAGFDNLTTIEIIDSLNVTKYIVKEILEEAKEKLK